jgi:hypothetical protein
MATSNQLVFHKQADAHPVISLTAPPENNIVLSSGETEMLRIAEDGFWVRGIKAKADDKEVEQVYNCFKEWLTWSTLNR